MPFTSRIYQTIVPDALKPQIVHRARAARRFLQRLLDPQGHPLAVEIETNSACTRTCGYCPRDPAVKDVMDEATFSSLIAQLAGRGYHHRLALHAYNEPLTDPRILDFAAEVRRKLPAAQLALYTNGDLLTADIARELGALGVAEVSLTLHDPLPEHLEARLRTITAINPFITISDFRKGKRRTPLHNRGGLVAIGPTQSLPWCYVVDSVPVRANGDVPMCVNDYHGVHLAGNIHDEGFWEIWEKPDFVRFRHDVHRGKYELNICQRCGVETQWLREDGA